MVAERNERRAFATDGHVRAAEVVDRGDPGANGDASGVPDLQRGLSCEVRDGLSVQRDEIGFRPETRDEVTCRGRVRVAERAVQRRQLVRGHGLPGSRAEHLLAELRRIVVVRSSRQDADVRLRRVVDLDRGDVDPIRRRSGHHPDCDHVRIVAPQGLASAS